MSEFVRVAATDEIPPGTAKRVQVNGHAVAVVNVGGTMYAIDDLCTHEDESLSEGPVVGEIITCPKHGSRFHVPTGRVLSLPAVRPVSTYAVTIVGNDVMLAPESRPGHGMPHRR